MLNKLDSCRSCLGWAWGCKGFVPASGSGENGVLVIAEAAGENEANEGMPLVGKAGYYLWQQLARVGIEREGFMVHNVLSCRPPDNKLAKMPYEAQVIAHCAPNLDATIDQMRRLCQQLGRTFVIVTLGKIAFKRIMDYTDRSPILKEDYLCYPHWNEKYRVWVVAADHPSYLMRGYHHLVPIMTFAFQRALEIARGGFALEQPQYILDPEPVHFKSWVVEYKKAYQADPDNTFLSYDIETPHKQGKDEEKVAKEEDDDYTILRCSFSYKPGNAVSVPWQAQYRPMLEELFHHPGAKVGWNLAYDSPRVRYDGLDIRGDELDGMLAWHVLNTSMPKGLGFVTPFYAQRLGMWKHLSSIEPAFYNAVDADAALRCWLGIRKDLVKNNLWGVFENHIIRLNRVLSYMSNKGVLRDEELRSQAELKLKGLLVEIQKGIEGAIPDEARSYKIYKKKPRSVDGMVQVAGDASTKRCPACGSTGVSAIHFKTIGVKRLKKGEPENTCFGHKAEKTIIPAKLWAKPLPFKLSMKSMTAYQRARKHRAIVNWKEKKVTFDAVAIERLAKLYPRDPLYPQILDFRSNQKLLSTYVGITEYQEVEVPDDYQLQPGEKWKNA